MYKKDAICPFCRRAFGLPFPPINEELRSLVLRIRKQLNKPAIDDPMDQDGIVQDVCLLIAFETDLAARAKSSFSFFAPQSMLLALPDEVLVSLFMHLPYQELCRISRTSRDVDRCASDGWLVC